MSTDWDIVISGTAFPFTGYGAIVTGMQGVGMAPVRNVVSSYALSPGGAHQRTKVESRSVIIEAALPGTSIANLHRLRGALINVVRADRDGTQTPLLLRYRGGSVPVEIEAYYDDGLQWSNPVGYTERLAMRFICPDPYFRGTATTTVSAIAPLQDSASFLARPAQPRWTFPAGLGTAALLRGTPATARILVDTSGNIYDLRVTTAWETIGDGGVRRWDQSTGTWAAYAGTMGLASNQRLIAACESGGTIYTAAGSITPSAGSITAGIRTYDTTGGWVSRGTVIFSTPTPNSYSMGVLPGLHLKATGGRVFAYGNDLYALNSIPMPPPQVAPWALFEAGAINGFFNIAALLGSPVTLTFATATTGHTESMLTDVIFDTASSYAYITATHSAIGGNVKINSPLSMGGTFLFSALRTTLSQSYSLGTANGAISTIVAIDDALVVGGAFTAIQGTSFPRVAELRGSAWSSAGSITTTDVRSLAYDRASARLYAIMDATNAAVEAAGVPVTDGLAYRDGGRWFNAGIDLPGTISPARFVFDSEGDNATLAGRFSGSATLGGYLTVFARGNARTGPTITIAGGSALTGVTNLTSGDQLTFQGYFMGRNETITLDFAGRSYTSTTQGTLLSRIAPGSRLSGWSLVPGTNIIHVVSSNATAQVSVTWRDRYWSIDT